VFAPNGAKAKRHILKLLTQRINEGKRERFPEIAYK
jgi:hypothetical protein